LGYLNSSVSGVEVVCFSSNKLFVVIMSGEDWGLLADEQEKKLATTVSLSVKQPFTVSSDQLMSHAREDADFENNRHSLQTYTVFGTLRYCSTAALV